MATKKKLLQAAAGSAGGAGGLNVEDVFSTYLYTGNNTTNTINNGIDLAGEGGLVWIKRRSNVASHVLVDTERGDDKYLKSDSTSGEATRATMLSFSSTGFSLDDGFSVTNGSGGDFASWTWRQAPKFFDVVTYTGNGTAGRTISHNLGSVPGMIIVKQTSSVSNWPVYHRSLGSSAYIELNSTNATTSNVTRWYGTDPTSTDFTVNVTNVNKLNETYVAYLFAHNDGDGEFGPDGDADVIKCGSFTTDAAAKATITLGWESQWVMVKRTDGTGGWIMVDIMRGAPQTNANYLYANLSGAEAAVGSYRFATPTATGFVFDGGLAASADYIYIAIRRGPMAVPTDATDVFAISDASGTDTPLYKSSFPIDMGFEKNTTGTNDWQIYSRLTEKQRLQTNTTAAESTVSTATFDFMNGYKDVSSNLPDYYGWMWKRAPSFFDAVAYTGTGSARTISHNLGVAPEMMWVKKRDQAENWLVYHSATGNTKSLRLNSTIAAYTDTNWNDTTPTDSVFSLGSSSVVNYSGHKFIAYLFASLDGVSKVGSFTGNGTTINIDCGFSSGARFVMTKRTDAGSDWVVWDTERGIVAGNDGYLVLNDVNEENSSYDNIDPYSSGFSLNYDGVATNISGASYIFYAIA